MNNSGFTIKLDKPPALAVIIEQGGRRVLVIKDGKKVVGAKSIEIEANAGEMATYKIEYWAGLTGDVEMQNGTISWSQDSDQKDESEV